MVHRKEMHMKETFGDRIRRLREEKNFKQVQVAELLGVNRKAISHYENNLREPSYEILIRMADLYHVRTDYLLGYDSVRLIDASGLSDREFSLITALVADLTEKNQKLKIR
jgi:transcriptional regulator with XRE-family HTH domain